MLQKMIDIVGVRYVCELVGTRGGKTRYVFIQLFMTIFPLFLLVKNNRENQVARKKLEK